MIKKRLIIAIFILCVGSPIAYAYLDKYPPYKFKEGPQKHLKTRALVDNDKSKYRSKDGKINVRLIDLAGKLNFIIKDGKTTVSSMSERGSSIPTAVWWVDLDKNGLKDFIVFKWYEGCGLAFYAFRVDIFLKEREGLYRKISYDTLSPGLEDIVDLNGDGKYEFIVTDIYSANRHTYFTYNIYELKNYKLVNADDKFKGFPKFIWYTYKANDKDTTHLTKKERTAYTDKKNSSIKYLEVK